MQINHLIIDGQTIRYAQDLQPQSDDPPVLLLNGIGAALELSDPLLMALHAQGLDTLTLDLPGIGGSDFAPRLRRMRGYAALVLALLDALDIPEVHLMGHSWGGALAQEFAHRNGKRVRSLVLASTGSGWFMVPGRPRALMAFLDPRLYRGSFLKLPGNEAPKTAPPANVRGIAPRGMALQVAAGFGWTSVHYLRRLAMPTLVVAGERDTLVPPINARWLAHTIPNAELCLVPRGGHFCPMTQAEYVSEAVKHHIGAAS